MNRLELLLSSLFCQYSDKTEGFEKYLTENAAKDPNLLFDLYWNQFDPALVQLIREEQRCMQERSS